MALDPQIRRLTHEPLQGDPGQLAAQLGAFAGVPELSEALGFSPEHAVNDLPSLGKFLGDYALQVLFPVELPVIRQAWQHANQNQLRELLDLDAQLDPGPWQPDFARASRAVGRSRLRRLGPLRGHRLVQRYLRAVQAGDAHGWHTLVYGLSLAVYSLPLRQGLLSYGWLTLQSFMRTGCNRLNLIESDGARLLVDLREQLPAAVDTALGVDGGLQLME